LLINNITYNDKNIKNLIIIIIKYNTTNKSKDSMTPRINQINRLPLRAHVVVTALNRYIRFSNKHLMQR